MTELKIRADQVRPGDLLDLFGDDYADPACDPSLAYEFLYVEVLHVESETPACVRIDHDAGSCGFPPHHMIRTARIDR